MASSEACFEVTAHRWLLFTGLPVKLLRLAGRQLLVPDFCQAMCCALHITPAGHGLQGSAAVRQQLPLDRQPSDTSGSSEVTSCVSAFLQPPNVQ